MSIDTDIRPESSDTQFSFSAEKLLPKPERQLEMSDAAHERLSEWGLSDARIAELAEMASQYEYANLRGKAKRIAETGGFLISAKGNDHVVLPDIWDYPGDRKDGQCGEIAVKLIRGMNDSGWLDSLNDELNRASKIPLVPIFANGQSRTHFAQVDSNHVWTGLIQDGKSMDSGVVVDGSFLIVNNESETGYNPQHVIINPGVLYAAATADQL